MKVLKQKVAKLLKLVFFVIPSSGVVQNCLTHSHNGNVTFYNEQCTTPSFFTTSLETIHSRTMASTKSNITQDCRFRNKVCAWRLNWLSNCRLSAWTDAWFSDSTATAADIYRGSLWGQRFCYSEYKHAPAAKKWL